MNLFLCLSCISLGLSFQKILPKVKAPERHKKGEVTGCIETEFYRKILNFLDTITMFLYYIIKIMNDDCYLFSSLNHQFEKYVPVILFI